MCVDDLFKQPWGDCAQQHSMRSVSTRARRLRLTHTPSLPPLTLPRQTRLVSLAQYRQQLFTYLQSNMAAVAQNLGALIGEVVGARLISHAGE